MSDPRFAYALIGDLADNESVKTAIEKFAKENGCNTKVGFVSVVLNKNFSNSNYAYIFFEEVGKFWTLLGFNEEGGSGKCTTLCPIKDAEKVKDCPEYKVFLKEYSEIKYEEKKKALAEKKASLEKQIKEESEKDLEALKKNFSGPRAAINFSGDDLDEELDFVVCSQNTLENRRNTVINEAKKRGFTLNSERKLVTEYPFKISPTVPAKVGQDCFRHSLVVFKPRGKDISLEEVKRLFAPFLKRPIKIIEKSALFELIFEDGDDTSVYIFTTCRKMSVKGTSIILSVDFKKNVKPRTT